MASPRFLMLPVGLACDAFGEAKGGAGGGARGRDCRQRKHDAPNSDRARRRASETPWPRVAAGATCTCTWRATCSTGRPSRGTCKASWTRSSPNCATLRARGRSTLRDSKRASRGSDGVRRKRAAPKGRPRCHLLSCRRKYPYIDCDSGHSLLLVITRLR
jgi:hypothetical protein